MCALLIFTAHWRSQVRRFCWFHPHFRQSQGRPIGNPFCARAIETGSYVLAAAQTGTHPAQSGKPRQTYGHSLAVSPWGEVLVDMGSVPGIAMVDLDLAEVAQSRKRIAALSHDRPFEGP